MVSIVIVNWNGRRWLKRCLESLVEQTYRELEIIVVDNNSQDGSVDYILHNFPSIKIIANSENSGFASGNNLGIGEARGEYILFLNNDTWVVDNFVESLMQKIISTSYDVLAPTERSYDGEISAYSGYKTIDFFGHPVMFDSTKNFYLSGVCLIFKKDLYLETLGLDNDFFMYFEETDWFWRLNLMNKKFGVVSDVFVNHYGAGSSGNGIKYNIFLWRNQNALQMILKNYKIINLIWVLPVYLIQNVFEILFFLIILKPGIAKAYLAGWMFNIKNIFKIMKKRKLIKQKRIVGDVKIFRKMYTGLGKLNHLNHYIKNI